MGNGCYKKPLNLKLNLKFETTKLLKIGDLSLSLSF